MLNLKIKILLLNNTNQKMQNRMILPDFIKEYATLYFADY